MNQLATVLSVVGNDERKKVSLVIEIDMLLLDKFLSRNSIQAIDPDDFSIQEIEDANHPLVAIWNENKHENLKQAVKFDEERKRNIRLAMRRCGDLEKWKSAINKINQTGWMIGRNPKKWKANFDWFIKDGTLEKILEDKFFSSRWVNK